LERGSKKNTEFEMGKFTSEKEEVYSHASVKTDSDFAICG
jgi:hypothetical protein